MKNTSIDYPEHINTMYKVITSWPKNISSEVAEMDLSPSHYFFSGEEGCQLSNKVKKSPSVVMGVRTSLPSLLSFSCDEQKRHRKIIDVKKSPSVVAGVRTSLPSLFYNFVNIMPLTVRVGSVDIAPIILISRKPALI